MSCPSAFAVGSGRGVIQIAGVLDVEEGLMLLEEGADFLGFPIGLAIHDEEITPEEARRIVRCLSLSDCGILITYLNTAREVLDLCRAVGLRRVQLHGEIHPLEITRLRAADPGLFLMKSLVVGESDAGGLQHLLRAYQPLVDAFITDTFDPETGARGATGKIHDWDVSRRLVERSFRPVILAGGLRPENVREAIERVRPAGVDAHTGLEAASGRKDRDLARAFIREARGALGCMGFAEGLRDGVSDDG